MRKLFILFFIYTNVCLGQSLQLPKNIQSPNAASLGKYGDVPISFYSGGANVNIPIYTMKEGDVNLDIALQYDASGVIVSSVPGWVGQNWSLNAGGVITRSINGIPDEWSYPHKVSGLSSTGYFYPQSHDVLNVIDWASLSNLEKIYTNNTIGNPNFINNLKNESQPDIFTFNFMGHSGKFFLGEDGQWKVSSDDNLKVTILESNFIFPPSDPITDLLSSYSTYQPKTIGKIEITDDQGITYTFGGSTPLENKNSIEYSKDFINQRLDYWKANSWYLTKVTNHLGITLYTLNYEKDINYTAIFYNYQNYTKYNAVFNQGLFSYDCQYSSGSGLDGMGGKSVGGNLISPIYLKSITSRSNEVINFNSLYSNSIYYDSAKDEVWSYLTNILSNMPSIDAKDFFIYFKTYSGATEIINKLKFRKLVNISGSINVKFRYNEPNYSGEHQNRFNLLGLTVDNSGIYSFEYDRFDQLPRLTSKAIDHMGYYRGVEYNTSDYSTHFNQRTTDADKVLIGSLKKIIYPTKGFTEFEYEPHLYSKYVSDNKEDLITAPVNSIIGGIRIKKISSNDNNGKTISKEYKYVKDYNLNHSSNLGSGILCNLPKYWWADWKIKAPPSSSPGTLSEDHFSVNPIIPMGNFFGSPVGYNEVVEINNDKSYTIYKYSSQEEYSNRDEAFITSFNVGYSPYEKYNDKSLLRGKLIETKIFNDSDVLLKKIVNNYTPYDPLSTKYIRGTNIDSKICPGAPGNGFNLGNAYKIYYFDNDKIKTQEINYTNSQEVKLESSFVFEYYPNLNTSFGDRFLRSTTTQTYLENTENGSEKVMEKYSYPFDITSAINNDLILKRIFQPLQRIKEKNNAVIATDKMEYSYYVPNINLNYLLPQKTLKSKGNESFEEDIIIDSYDNFGNITQYHNKDGVFTTLSWGYRYEYPILKIIGNQISDRTFINSITTDIESLLNNGSSPSWLTQLNAIMVKLNTVRNNYTNHMVTSYTFRPFFGVSSITEPNGRSKFYEYDDQRRLILVKDGDGNAISRNEYNYKP